MEWWCNIWYKEYPINRFENLEEQRPLSVKHNLVIALSEIGTTETKFCIYESVSMKNVEKINKAPDRLDCYWSIKIKQNSITWIDRRKKKANIILSSIWYQLDQMHLSIIKCWKVIPTRAIFGLRLPVVSCVMTRNDGAKKSR